MIKYTILLLIFIAYTNAATDYHNYFQSYDLISDKLITCYFETSQYDYFVLGGSLHGYTRINVQFTPLTHTLNSYYITTKTVIGQSNINDYFSHFYNMALQVPVGTSKSITYTTDPDYPNMYFGFGPAYSSGHVEFTFKTYLISISTLATYIIVLIVIGGLIFLAAVSMGIAKAMGRNAWEGLACFCIICTICCCRR